MLTRVAAFLAAGLLLAWAPQAWSFACASTGGNWNTPATWTACNATVPQPADTVTVTSGTVILDTNSTITSLTVNGTLTLGNSVAARTLTVTGAVTVTGAMQPNTGFAASHSVLIGGNLTNDGTFDMASAATSLAAVTFNGAGSRTISGTGATTRFYRLIVSLGASAANILDYTATNFQFSAAPVGCLVLANGGIAIPSAVNCLGVAANPATGGTFRLSSPGTNTIAPFNSAPVSASAECMVIGATAGFWLNSATSTVNVNTASATCTGGAAPFNISLQASTFRVTAGTLNMTAGANQTIRLRTNAASTYWQEGGTVTIGGRLSSVAAANNGVIRIDGGTLNLGTIDNSVATFGPFFLGSGASSNFIMTGGTVVIQRASTAAANEYDNRAPASTVTGGTIQFGNASTPAATTMQVRSTPALPSVLINATNAPNITLATAVSVVGDWTNNATFTNGGFLVTFSGGNAQTLGGANASAFAGLTINKTANDVTMGGATPSPTVSGTLTLTARRLIMANCAANPISLGTAGLTAGGSATSYVQGPILKNFLAAGVFTFSGAADEFPVGTATGYSPIDVTAGTTSTAGSVRVCATSGADHPQVQNPPVGGGTIDLTKSVNRYWSVTTTGINVTAVPLTATFTFIAGDLDAGPPNTANFIVERHDGAVWHATSRGTATATSTQAANIVLLGTGTNDFAVGEPYTGFTAVPGRFNAFETATPSPEILGKIQTKQSGVAFALDIVSINAAKTAYGGAVTPVTVELWNSSAGGVLDANGCNTPAWAFIQTVTAALSIPASGRVTLPGITVTNSFRDVRVRITGGGNIGCSTDRFAIRPQSITIAARDTDWRSAVTSPTAGRTLANIAATGGNVHAAAESAGTARSFTLRATPAPGTATNYDGNPTQVAPIATNTVCCTPPACATLPATCTVGTLTLGTWGAATGSPGVRESVTASYSEAGVVNTLLEDAAYASVDAVDGSTPATRTVPSSIAQIGRFVPDRFGFTGPSTPQFQTYGAADGTCQVPPSGSRRSFTYIGQGFWYLGAALPSATVQALNANGSVTTNYRGVLFKLATANFAESYSNNATGPSLDTSLIGTPALTAVGNGVGTYTAAAAGLLAYQRSTAAIIPANSNSFTANLSLTVNATDANENAVAGNPGNGATPALTSATPLVFNGGGTGVTFDGGAFLPASLNILGGKAFVYGRLRLDNAAGGVEQYAATPPYRTLLVPARTEYWTGTGFSVNSSDHCTSLSRSNIALGSYAKNLAACETFLSVPTVTFTAGVGSLTMSNPGAGNDGSVNLTPQLGAASGNYCAAVGAGPGPGAVSAVKSYLQGNWTGGLYDQNPTGRAAFGVYGAQPRQFIFFRENY